MSGSKLFNSTDPTHNPRESYDYIHLSVTSENTVLLTNLLKIATPPHILYPFTLLVFFRVLNHHRHFIKYSSALPFLPDPQNTST